MNNNPWKMFIQGMKHQAPHPPHMINEEIHQIANTSSLSAPPSHQIPTIHLQQPKLFPHPQQQPLASIPLTSRSDIHPRQLLHDDLNDDDEEENMTVQSAHKPTPPTSQMPSVRYQRSQYL